MKLLDKIFPARAKLKLLENKLDFNRAEMIARRRMEKRRYEAGRQNRLTENWPVSPTTADQDVKESLVSLRARARHLEQNDPLTKRFLNLSRKNIAGAYGFTLKMKVSDVDKDGNRKPDKLANTKITEAWNDWCKKENCDVTGSDSFRRIQHIVIQHLQRDGEYLVRGIINKSSKYGFQLQVLEPDMIDETYNARLQNGNVVIMGIEFDKFKRRIAFHLKKYDSTLSVYTYSSFSHERDRVPASEIYYDFNKSRAFQSRGVSPMSASMMRMKRISDYEDAAVTNAVIAARRLGFISNTDGGDEFKGNDEDESGNAIIDTEEGSYHLLDPGYSVSQPDPAYPDAQHEMFMKSAQKRVASGLDVSYITLANDLAETSYSSGRIGLLDERETWMMLQEDLIEPFLEPVFAEWLRMALLNKSVNLPAWNFEKFNKPYFVGKRWSWVDPLRDLEAKALELKLGITSLARIAAENGDDLEDLFDEIKTGNELAEKYGIKLNFDSKELSPAVAETVPPAKTEKPGNGKAGKKYLELFKEILNVAE